MSRNAISPYNRDMAILYAEWWALRRNPQYLDFSNFGGDCTNFCSQVLYAGGCRMNYTRTYGWYYKNGYDKAPAWTGVECLYNCTGGGCTTNSERRYNPVVVCRG